MRRHPALCVAPRLDGSPHLTPPHPTASHIHPNADRGNGVRYNKEPLLLRRQPDNPYDRNAIGVFTTAWRQVGHVVARTGDVAVLARVADDSVRHTQTSPACHPPSLVLERALAPRR